MSRNLHEILTVRATHLTLDVIESALWRAKRAALETPGREPPSHNDFDDVLTIVQGWRDQGETP